MLLGLVQRVLLVDGWRSFMLGRLQEHRRAVKSLIWQTHVGRFDIDRIYTFFER